MVVIEELDFPRFVSKISLGGISYIASDPVFQTNNFLVIKQVLNLAF